jgi:hypothetical protein
VFFSSKMTKLEKGKMNESLLTIVMMWRGVVMCIDRPNKRSQTVGARHAYNYKIARLTDLRTVLACSCIIK